MPWPIQDVSAGSKLWKLVTGINQRLSVLSNGTNAIRYEGESWTNVTDPAQGGVVSRANVQSVNFWYGLQQNVYLLRVFGTASFRIAPQNGVAYSSDNGDAWDDGSGNLNSLIPASLPASTKRIRAFDEIGQERINDDIFGFGTFIQTKDIVGDWLIDDLVSILSELQWMVVRPVGYEDPNEKQIFKSGISFGATCAEAYASASSSFFSSSFGGSASGIFNTTLFGRVVSGGSPVTSAQANYTQGQTSVSYSVPPGISGTLLHVSASGKASGVTDYYPVATRFQSPGMDTVKTSTSGSITASMSDAGYLYTGEFPPSVLGLSCSNPGTKGAEIHHEIVLKGDFADLN